MQTIWIKYFRNYKVNIIFRYMASSYKLWTDLLVQLMRFVILKSCQILASNYSEIPKLGFVSKHINCIVYFPGFRILCIFCSGFPSRLLKIFRFGFGFRQKDFRFGSAFNYMRNNGFFCFGFGSKS